MPMDWPASLPQQFSSNGYQDAFADNRYNTNPELGPALIRSRVTSMPRRLTGVMIMNKTQLDRLRQFWKVDTLDGKLPFLFPDPIFGYGWRRNYIYNTGYAGGVVGNPGTLPTGWGSTGVQNGITKAVVDMGVESGLQYTDVHFSGTPSGGAAAALTFALSPYTIVAAGGEAWTESFYARMVAGTKNNITVFGPYMYDTPSGAGGVVNNVLDSLSTLALINQRYSVTMKAAPVGTTGMQPGVYIAAKPGIFMDITIRLAGPQAEKSSKMTDLMPTPNTSRPIARFAAGGRPPQPSFLGGRTWSATLELEIFET